MAHEAQPSVSLMFLPHFDVLCDLLLNRRTATWNLTALYNKKLEIVITRAAPDFHKLFMVMGCVLDINTVHKTVEKLTFQAFY